MIRIFTHKSCMECRLCNNPYHIDKEGGAHCAAFIELDKDGISLIKGKLVKPDMSECPFPVISVSNDLTPGRMLMFESCKECPACENKKVPDDSCAYCLAHIQTAAGGRVTGRGKAVAADMTSCPFPEGYRFKGSDGETVYGIGMDFTMLGEDMPTWTARTSEGILLAIAFTRYDLLEKLKGMSVITKE